jgi:hypothetical protein
MIFINVILIVCRTYGAQEYLCLRYPALTGWANLWRASGARGLWLQKAGATNRFHVSQSRSLYHAPASGRNQGRPL